MSLQNKSTELMEKIHSLRNEDFRLTFNEWREWWSLSGIEDIGVMPCNSPFKYVLKTAPFDYWMATIDPESLISKHDFYEEYEKEEIEKMVSSIKETINYMEGEEPHTIAFTSIPMPCGFPFELVGLAKILNNGTSYVFSNDLNYLKYLRSRGL